jgi:hypothetical protein
VCGPRYATASGSRVARAGILTAAILSASRITDGPLRGAMLDPPQPAVRRIALSASKCRLACATPLIWYVGVPERDGGNPGIRLGL